jgi:hypothetical protein
MRDLLDAPSSERPVYLADLAEREKLPPKALGMLRLLREDLSHKGTRDRAVILLAAGGMGFSAEEIANLARTACAELPEGRVSVTRHHHGGLSGVSTETTVGPDQALSMALRLWLQVRDTLGPLEGPLFMGLGDDPSHGLTALTPGMVRAILGGYVTPADAAKRTVETLQMLSVVADAEALSTTSDLLSLLLTQGLNLTRDRLALTADPLASVAMAVRHGITLQKRAIAFQRATGNPLDTRALSRLERGLFILRRARMGIVSQRRIESAEAPAGREGAS